MWRLLIAALCFVCTYEAWHIPNRWVYFTFQTGFALGFVMLWAGAASLLSGIQPPAWLKGCVTLFAVVTALVAFFMLPPDDPATVAKIFGVMTNTILHRVLPIAAVLDFLLFDQHRRFAWHYPLSWLLYLPLYLAFVLIRARIWPTSGPSAAGNPYPYGFLDLAKLGLPQFGINVVAILLVFLVVGLILFLLDRILPKRAILH